MKLSKIISWSPVLLALSMFACSNATNPISGIDGATTSNNNSVTTTSTTSSGSSTDSPSISSTDNTLSDVKIMNINLSNSVGLLAFSVRQPLGPLASNISGEILNAHFIAFKTVQAQQFPFHEGGLDVGTITLTHNGTTMTFQKHEVKEGGVVYDLLPPPRRGTKRGQQGPNQNQSQNNPIIFKAGSPIEVSISGNSNFAATNMSFSTNNINELKITSPANATTIDTTKDLTLTWAGGSANEDGVIRILPAPPKPGSQQGPNPQGGRGMRQGGPGMGQGGPNGQNGPGNGNGQFAPKPLAQIQVTAGATSYTISASDLQSYISGFKGQAIRVEYAQLNSKDNSTPAGTITSVFRNRAGVILKLN